MKTSKKDKTEHDAAAFGIPEDENGARCWGLTVREYFAVHLMAGQLANPNASTLNDSADAACLAADILIEALNKE